MGEDTGHTVQPPQPTSSLQQFAILVGEWTMVGSHPAFSSEAHGRSSFTWLKDEALLLWHFEWDEPPPAECCQCHRSR